MIISHVYRRTLLLSIAVILVLTMLAAAVVSSSFFHTAAKASPHVQHPVAPYGATIKGSMRRYAGSDAVPSWDIMAYYVTVRCFS
jgi:hypothetical protein